MSLALVTAIYGGHDELHPLPAGIQCDDAVCVTDDPDLFGSGWRMVYEPRVDEHPNRAAKYAKCLPWLYTECDSSVWIDASYAVLDPAFPRHAISYADPWAAHQHPVRDCIYDEARTSLAMPKYQLEPIQQQVDYYRDFGHPEHWGLWENGCTARQHTWDARRLSQSWLWEIERWSYQDQISAPYLFHVLGMRPSIIPRDPRWIENRPGVRHIASYSALGGIGDPPRAHLAG